MTNVPTGMSIVVTSPAPAFVVWSPRTRLPSYETRRSGFWSLWETPFFRSSAVIDASTIEAQYGSRIPLPSNENVLYEPKFAFLSYARFVFRDEQAGNERAKAEIRARATRRFFKFRFLSPGGVRVEGNPISRQRGRFARERGPRAREEGAPRRPRGR